MWGSNSFLLGEKLWVLSFLLVVAHWGELRVAFISRLYACFHVVSFLFASCVVVIQPDLDFRFS